MVIKIGMISFAHMHAYSYAQALLDMPGVELTGVADENEKRGKEVALKYKTQYFSSKEELLASEIDGVIITSENANHLGDVLAASGYGRHILCEKPISTSINEARQIITACNKAGVILEIAFPCRYHPSAKRAREIILSGELGQILAVKATNHGKMPGGWFIDKNSSGGGAVIDHTVHVVDLMRWFFKREIVEVYAEADTFFHDLEVEDAGLLSLKLEGGIIATLDTSWSRPDNFPIWGDVVMEIVGSNGVINLDMFSQNISIYKDSKPTTLYESWGSDADYLLVNNFVESIKGNETPLISGEDGLKALEVALGAYRSIDSHQVIQI